METVIFNVDPSSGPVPVECKMTRIDLDGTESTVFVDLVAPAKWTHNKPEADSYYWMRYACTDDSFTDPVVIKYDSEGEMILGMNRINWEPILNDMQFWSVPIAPPEA